MNKKLGIAFCVFLMMASGGFAACGSATEVLHSVDNHESAATIPVCDVSCTIGQERYDEEGQCWVCHDSCVEDQLQGFNGTWGWCPASDDGE